MGLKWAYGITTVPSRQGNLFNQTLESLKSAGFDSPWVFVDGGTNQSATHYESELKLHTTIRVATPGHPFGLRTYGNWILSLAELYVRFPRADRYALFQDDFVTYPNLRKYLDSCPFPDHGYWNLYTFNKNERVIKGKPYGWYEACTLSPGPDYHGKRGQKGLGAVALVFDLKGVVNLLKHPHMVERPLDPFRGWRAVDGAIVTAMNKEGFREYVHNPSLTQHIGKESSMGSKPHAQADTFMGTGFDAANFIR